jgi:hypothetical protein
LTNEREIQEVEDERNMVGEMRRFMENGKRQNEKMYWEKRKINK